MNVFEFIKSLGKEDLANLLYFIYNIGYMGSDDISDVFNEDFMDHDKEELDKLIQTILPHLT